MALQHPLKIKLRQYFSEPDLPARLPEKARKAFPLLSLEKQVKILLNDKSISYDILRNTFLEIFPECRPELINEKTLLNLSVRLELWNNNTLDENIISEIDDICSQWTVKTNFIPYSAYYIFGCPLSTDIDIAFVVDSFHGEIDISSVQREFAEKNTKKIDYNMIKIGVDGNIAEAFKGDKHETQNMIFSTYHLHPQKFSLPFNKMIIVDDIELRIRTIAKFILDNLKIIISTEDYQMERIAKMNAYDGYWGRVEYVLAIIDKIIAKTDISNYEWKSVMKAIVMKIIQLVLAQNNARCYTKIELAGEYDKVYSGTREYALYFLTRGTMGTYSETFLSDIFDIYYQTANAINPPKINLIKCDLDIISNATSLPDEIYREFIKSPLFPTSIFNQYMKNAIPDRNINSYFQLKCSNIDKLPSNILQHVVAVDQRSPEWKRLLKFYTCGSNNGVIPYDGEEWVKFYYNLIRGCIMEQVVIQNFDFDKVVKSHVDKIMVGFLVESREEKSIGIAPDLILRSVDELIPVEIKCLVGQPSQNHDFRRAVTLAKRELSTSMKILNATRSIIVLVFIYQNNNEYVYETYII
jgi:hypothetical protein